MKTVDVMMVRIYITEASNQLKQIINYLKNDANIRGISVFRAISGFGESGAHTSALLDLSLDLPLAVEFFDSVEKITPALEYLSGVIKHEHIVYWRALAND